MQILAVVVRYKTSLRNSQTVQSLVRIFGEQPHLLESVGVVVWDNSPAPLANPGLPFPVTYRHSAQNLGVAGAYNRAMEIAELAGCSWLLLLDQDTSLPDRFLPRMLELAHQMEPRAEIAAIAPFLVDRGRPISPGQLLSNGVKLIRCPFEGVHPGRMYAANSGTLVRVSSLREIGGFDENFWLDLSDIVAFHLLYERGKVLYIAGDLRLRHRVTLNDYDGSMSPQRYMNFINAEGAYWDIYRRPSERLLQTGRLLLRSFRQLFRYRNKAYARITFFHFLRRLFWTKRSRLQQWKRQSKRRDMPAVLQGKVVN